MPRVAIVLLCALAVLTGSAAASTTDASTELPFCSGCPAWLAVDPSGGHVFVSGGPGTSSIVVLDFSGTIVKTITHENGSSQMAVNTANHTLYVALHDATAISAIDTRTLTERKRFSTAPYPNPSDIAVAGGRLWFTCHQNDGEGCHGVIEAHLDGSRMRRAPGRLASYYFATALAAGGPRHKYLAVADSYQEPPMVDVYNVSRAKPRRVSHVGNPDGGSAQVRDMTFDRSGAHLLLACGYPYYVESLTRKTLLSSAEYPTGPYPVAVAASRDGKFVATVRADGAPNVQVYRVDGTTPTQTWEVGDSGQVTDHDLAFSPDGSKLFVVAEDSEGVHLAFYVLSR